LEVLLLVMEDVIMPPIDSNYYSFSFPCSQNKLTQRKRLNINIGST